MFQRLKLNVLSDFLPLLVDHHPGQHGLQGHPPVLQRLHHTVGGPKGVLRDDQGHDGPQGGGQQGVAEAEDDDAVETGQKIKNGSQNGDLGSMQKEHECRPNIDVTNGYAKGNRRSISN